MAVMMVIIWWGADHGDYFDDCSFDAGNMVECS